MFDNNLHVRTPPVVYIDADAAASVLPRSRGPVAAVNGVGLQLDRRVRRGVCEPGLRENESTAVSRFMLGCYPGSQLIQLVVEGADVGE